MYKSKTLPKNNKRMRDSYNKKGAFYTRGPFPKKANQQTSILLKHLNSDDTLTYTSAILTPVFNTI